MCRVFMCSSGHALWGAWPSTGQCNGHCSLWCVLLDTCCNRLTCVVVGPACTCGHGALLALVSLGCLSCGPTTLPTYAKESLATCCSLFTRRPGIKVTPAAVGRGIHLSLLALYIIVPAFVCVCVLLGAMPALRLFFPSFCLSVWLPCNFECAGLSAWPAASGVQIAVHLLLLSFVCTSSPS